MNPFITEDLDFASFVRCTNKLDFLNCQRNERGKVSFFFEDPESRGNSLYQEYQNGGVGPIIAFLSAEKILRREKERVEGRRNVSAVV